MPHDVWCEAMKILTEELLNTFMTHRGGWRKRTILLLGEEWPLRNGWRQRLIGTLIDDERIERLRVDCEIEEKRRLDKSRSLFDLVEKDHVSAMEW